MQSQNKLFDDLVKVMNGAAGAIAGMTREAQAAMQERARDWVGGLDMVSREEFETVKALAVAAREHPFVRVELGLPLTVPEQPDTELVHRSVADAIAGAREDDATTIEVPEAGTPVEGPAVRAPAVAAPAAPLSPEPVEPACSVP